MLTEVQMHQLSMDSGLDLAFHVSVPICTGPDANSACLLAISLEHASRTGDILLS